MRALQGLAAALATALACLAPGVLAQPPAAPAASGVRAGVGGADSEIVLGQSASFSGAFASQAAAYRDGARAYFAHVNAQGGVHGRKIRLVSLDDGYRVEQALANTEQLIRREQVFALFNYTWTNTVKAVIPVAEREGVPMFGPYTGYEALYAAHSPVVFTTRASFADELGHIVRHLRTIGFSRIGLLHYDSASGRELLADTQRRMAAAQLTLAAVGTMATGSKDPAAAVVALAAADPQALIIGASGSDAVAFIQAFDRQRAGRTRHYARSLIGHQQLVDELGPLAAGVSISQTAPNPFRNRAPVAVEYRRLLQQLDPALKPAYIGLEGMISAKVFVEALRRAGPRANRAALLRSLEALGTLDVGGYSVRYGPRRHHGAHYVDITLIGSGQRIVD
ncbi:MAG: ABC transporter substrate-binding protein [Burkholderiales bacterium]|nr:ABC transporter substrate-binding protein [Burkholderiales bacterium]